MSHTLTHSTFKPSISRSGSHVLGVIGMISLWYDRRIERRHLAELPKEALTDIGVSASAARAEASKPFWVA